MSSRSSTPIPTNLVSNDKLDGFPDNVRKEVQRLISVKSYERIKSKDMKGKGQEKEIEKHYHGLNDLVGQVWKFLQLKDSVYVGMVHQEDVHKTGQSSNLPIVISSKFTRSDNVLILGERGNVTKNALRRVNMKSPNVMRGRNILGKAKEAAREAKKMVSQMKEAVRMGIVELNDGEYTFSWIVIVMPANTNIIITRVLLDWTII